MTKYFCFFLFSLFLFSCSDSNEPEELPLFVGTWERYWIDKDTNLNLKETLVFTKDEFNGNIQIVEEVALSSYVAYEGDIAAVDNTLEAWIRKIGLAENGTSYSYFGSSDNNFENMIKDNLGRNSNFIGTFFVDQDELTLRLDMDGDRSVSGDEGLFIYSKVENE